MKQMAKVIGIGVKTAKKRSRHTVDYRCPYCNSRSWVPRSRRSNGIHKYICTKCGCVFDKLKMTFVITDYGHDDKQLLTCPSCNRIYKFKRYGVENAGSINIQFGCMCRDVIFNATVDESNTITATLTYIPDEYINKMSKDEAMNEKIDSGTID